MNAQTPAQNPSEAVLIRKFFGDPPRIDRDESHPRAPQGNRYYETNGEPVSAVRAAMLEIKELSPKDKTELADMIRASGFVA